MREARHDGACNGLAITVNLAFASRLEPLMVFTFGRRQPPKCIDLFQGDLLCSGANGLDGQFFE